VQGGFGPRFALEAVFLIVVAIGAGVAELSATAIVAVMAGAWLLVCLFELAVWAEGPRFPAFGRDTTAVVEEPEPAGAPDEVTDPQSVAAVDAPREAEGA
jgi:hypothetical protein